MVQGLKQRVENTESQIKAVESRVETARLARDAAQKKVDEWVAGEGEGWQCFEQTSLQTPADERAGAASGTAAAATGAALASGGGEGGGTAQGARQPALRSLQCFMSESSSVRVRLCRRSSVEASRPAGFHGGRLP